MNDDLGPKQQRINKTFGDFEVRYGIFYNYNPTIDPEKMEIRITCADWDLSNALYEKIIGWLDGKYAE